MDFMGAISLATRSLELAKAIKDIDKQLGEAELKAKSAELLSNLADVKVALVDARDALDQKEREIARLKAAFQLREDCLRHGSFLYAKKPGGSPSGHPYCPRCEQVDGVMRSARSARLWRHQRDHLRSRLRLSGSQLGPQLLLIIEHHVDEGMSMCTMLDTTAPIAAECQSFLDHVIAQFGES